MAFRPTNQKIAKPSRLVGKNLIMKQRFCFEIRFPWCSLEGGEPLNDAEMHSKLASVAVIRKILIEVEEPHRIPTELHTEFLARFPSPSSR